MLKRLIACVAVLLATVAYAQPTAFTFQGRLDSAGSPVSGLYDFEFRLYDDATVGPPDTLIAGPISFSGASALTVTNGTFTALLDFGLPPYADGSGRFVEVRTRPTGAPTYTTLSPRQQVTSAPYAMTAKNLPIPFSAFGPSATGTSAAFSIENTGAGGSGITTLGQTWGLVGFGGPLADYIPILTPAGVFGIGTAIGVGGTSVNGSGVYGASDTGDAGLFVASSGATSNALHAQVLGATGGYAGFFDTTSSTNPNPALRAQTASTQSGVAGVYGLVSSTLPGGFSAGIRGENDGTSGNGIGVWGTQNGGGYGVYGTAVSGYGVIGGVSASTGTNYGVYGSTNSAAGYAGYFVGRVNVTGALSKGGGSFKIDHPLDPENKFLYHSFVESPDMKNIYDGVVTTDGRGYATVAATRLVRRAEQRLPLSTHGHRRCGQRILDPGQGRPRGRGQRLYPSHQRPQHQGQLAGHRHSQGSLGPEEPHPRRRDEERQRTLQVPLPRRLRPARRPCNQPPCPISSPAASPVSADRLKVAQPLRDNLLPHTSDASPQWPVCFVTRRINPVRESHAVRGEPLQN